MTMKHRFKPGQRVKVPSSPFGYVEGTVMEIAPKRSRTKGFEYLSASEGMTIDVEGIGEVWSYQHKVEPIVEEEKPVFKHGDRAIVTARSVAMIGFEVGEEVTVLGEFSGDSWRIQNADGVIGYSDFEDNGLRKVGGDLDEVSALLEQIAEINAKVAELLKERSGTDIAEEARKDIEDLTRKMRSSEMNDVGNHVFRYRTTKPEFHVNERKGVTVALVKGLHGDVDFGKGIARLSKEDVFVEEVGKVIALRRALGLEVPQKYLTQGGR